MSERELHVPRLGRVVADDGFRLVAAMNPFDAVGTARISSAVYDRVCRLSVDYQSAPEEEAIVTRAVPVADERWVANVVELVRRTRTHPDLRVGSSVRGALDASAVVASLAAVREQPVTTPSVGLDAILIALSGRVRLREGCLRTSEEIITELWGEVFGTTRHERAGAPEGKAIAPTGASPA
jgi:MoxR-like ATPase